MLPQDASLLARLPNKDAKKRLPLSCNNSRKRKKLSQQLKLERRPRMSRARSSITSLLTLRKSPLPKSWDKRVLALSESTGIRMTMRSRSPLMPLSMSSSNSSRRARRTKKWSRFRPRSRKPQRLPRTKEFQLKIRKRIKRKHLFPWRKSFRKKMGRSSRWRRWISRLLRKMRVKSMSMAQR